MNKLASSLIAASMVAFAGAASAQAVDTRQPQPSVLKPAPENSSTGPVADNAGAKTRAEVKADTKASMHDKPVDQTGLKKSDQPMSTKSRADVKSEMKADKAMGGAKKDTPIPAPDAKNTSAVSPAVAK